MASSWIAKATADEARASTRFRLGLNVVATDLVLRAPTSGP